MREIRVTEPQWKAVEVGPDRIYADRALSAERVTDMAALLERERSILESLACIAPPPLAVLLRTDDYANTLVPPDPDGRPVWDVARRDDQKIDLVVHEWTHAILTALHYARDEDERFLEDGFCDYVALVIHGRLRGAGSSMHPAGRAKALKAKAATLPARVDIVAMAADHRVADLTDQAKMCSNPPMWGYAAGLSLWLDRADHDPDLAAYVFAAIRASRHRSFQDILGRGRTDGVAPRDLVVQRAISRLEQAAPPSDIPVSNATQPIPTLQEHLDK